MSLSKSDAMRLKKAGFLNYEISYFHDAVSPADDYQPKIDLNSPVWQAAMSKRRAFWREKLSQGYSESRIVEILVTYYRQRFRVKQAKRNPYDFIRAEYRPPGKLSDYYRSVRRRAKDRIARSVLKSRTYKRGAGR